MFRFILRFLVLFAGVVAASVAQADGCNLSPTFYDLADSGLSRTLPCLAGGGAITNSGSTDAILTITGSAGGAAYTGTLSDGSDGRVGLVVDGGALTLTGPTGFSGDVGQPDVDAHRSTIANARVTTLVNGGTLVVTADSLGIGALGLIDGTLKSAGGAISLANNIAVGRSSTGPFAGTGGRATFDTSAGDITLTGVLAGYYHLGDFPTDGGLVKTGAGTLVLAPRDADGAETVNELHGAIQIRQGTVEVATLGALGSSSPTVRIYGGATLSTTADIDGSEMTLAIGCVGAGACAGSAIATAADTTLILGAIGSLDGDGGLVKAGAGTLRLTAASSFTGGTQLLAGTLVVTDLGALSDGRLDMADGTTLRFEEVAGTFANDVRMSGVGDPTITVCSGSEVTMSGVISGAGELTKKGSGTLILTGTSTHTGTTRVAAGMLDVEGSIASSPMTTVSSSASSSPAVLTGTGSVGGLTVDYGIVKPGNSAAPTGTLLASGPVTFTANSVLAVSVGAAGASKLAVTGAATVGGTVSATLITPDAAPKAGARYAILTATDGVSGRFGGLVAYGFGGLGAYLAYDANDVYLQFGPDRGVIAASVTQLVRDRQGQMITGRILASVLLGANEQVSCSSACVSAFGSVGSFQMGTHGRAALTDEFSVVAGVAWTMWDSGGARSESAPMLAAALRWDPEGFGSSRPYAEVGLTTTPWSRSRYARSYDFGGMSYTGRGTADTSSLGLFAKLGWVARLAPTDEIAASVETSTGWMRTGAYTEAVGLDNPLPGSFGAAVDRMNVAKIGGQWTHLWGRSLETQINFGFAGSFGSKSGVRSDFAGYGGIEGASREAVWGEYGLRVGWRVNSSLVADVFADGTVGAKPVGNTVHGGFGLRHAF